MQRMIISVIIMAVVTYAIRALPVTLINKDIKSVFVRSFLYYVPYAVLASLTFPAIFYSSGNVKCSIVGTVVAVILAYCGRGLVTVALGAILTVLLCEYVPFLT